jgi:hypothetical protein
VSARHVGQHERVLGIGFALAQHQRRRTPLLASPPPSRVRSGWTDGARSLPRYWRTSCTRSYLAIAVHQARSVATPARSCQQGAYMAMPSPSVR